jgi:tRNA (guanine26-N2/guanine27-N2)-dimethyltransferase
MSALSEDQIQVPEGFKLHTENSAHLLLPDSNDAFLNPVQEFNRDLSVACIRVWAAERDEQRKEKWLLNNRRQHDVGKPGKRRKGMFNSYINILSDLFQLVTSQWITPMTQKNQLL